MSNKIEVYERILDAEHLSDQDVAYMADDVVDLAVLARVGFSCAPADAVPDVRSRVDWVSRFNGGDGAVRELVELVLRAQGTWDAVVSSYEHEPAGGASRK